MVKSVFFCGVAAVVVFSACSFDAQESSFTQSVDIALPVYPSQGMPPLAGWLVVTQENARKKEQFVSASAASVRLSLAQNQIAPVLCYPLSAADSSGATHGVRFFYPAGCIYPVSLSAEWKHGFEAELALGLLTGGTQDADSRRALVSSFNWRRLHEEIKSVSNPWNMTMSKFKTAITAKSFTKTIIKEQKTVDAYVKNHVRAVYEQYVPNAAVAQTERSDGRSEGFSYAFSEVRENLVFDGKNVFRVCKPERPGGTGETAFSLALMPLSLYSW